MRMWPRLVPCRCLPVMSQLNVEYPISEGQVRGGRWEDMDALWNYTFNKLNVSTKDSLVLLTEAPLNSMQNRIQVCVSTQSRRRCDLLSLR